MLHQGPAQYAVVDVEQPLAVGATRCGETLGLIGEKDPIGLKGGYYRRFEGLFFGNRGLFFAQRNPTRDKRSHEEPQTKNHGRSFLCLSRLLDVTRRKTRTLEKTGGPCFFGETSVRMALIAFLGGIPRLLRKELHQQATASLVDPDRAAP